MITKNTQIFKLAGVVLTCAVISACSGTDVSNPPSLNSGEESSGSADFSAFVSIGDSLTAGYADAALYLLGQTNSFPNILSQQFATVGGGGFVQPLVDDDLGGLVYDGVAIPDSTITGDDKNSFKNRFVLNTNPDPSVKGENPSPERLAGIGTSEINSTALNGMTFNNMGVPGAKSFHLGFPGLGNVAGIDQTEINNSGANPYFVRFAKTPASSVIGDAAAQAPTFFTLWIGNNDVLSFATSGGHYLFGNASAVDQTGSGLAPNLYGPNDITDPVVFADTYAQLVGAMKMANPDVQGVLVNIPDIKTIPFFTTVPYNPVPLAQADADKLNTAYEPYNFGVQLALDNSLIDADEAARRTIVFAEGQNAVVISTDFDAGDLTPLLLTGVPLPSWRQATADDLILLSAGGIIGEEETENDPTSIWGLGEPLRDEHVLIPMEIAAIDTARAAFNDAIKATADADDNLILFDVAALMQELSETGIDFGTGSVNASFVTGGAFSLDGVHPTARGYALIANGIIDAINTGFDANVYKVDPVKYSTVFVK